MPYYEESETYILASLLDPRFKLRWCKRDVDKIRYKALLKNQATKYINSSTTTLLKLQMICKHRARKRKNPMDVDPAKFWKEK